MRDESYRPVHLLQRVGMRPKLGSNTACYAFEATT